MLEKFLRTYKTKNCQSQSNKKILRNNNAVPSSSAVTESAILNPLGSSTSGPRDPISQNLSKPSSKFSKKPISPNKGKTVLSSRNISENSALSPSTKQETHPTCIYISEKSASVTTNVRKQSLVFSDHFHSKPVSREAAAESSLLVRPNSLLVRPNSTAANKNDKSRQPHGKSTSTFKNSYSIQRKPSPSTVDPYLNPVACGSGMSNRRSTYRVATPCTSTTQAPLPENLRNVEQASTSGLPLLAVKSNNKSLEKTMTTHQKLSTNSSSHESTGRSNNEPTTPTNVRNLTNNANEPTSSGISHRSVPTSSETVTRRILSSSTEHRPISSSSIPGQSNSRARNRGSPTRLVYTQTISAGGLRATTSSSTRLQSGVFVGTSNSSPRVQRGMNVVYSSATTTRASVNPIVPRREPVQANYTEPQQERSTSREAVSINTTL